MESKNNTQKVGKVDDDLEARGNLGSGLGFQLVRFLQRLWEKICNVFVFYVKRFDKSFNLFKSSGL